MRKGSREAGRANLYDIMIIARNMFHRVNPAKSLATRNPAFSQACSINLAAKTTEQRSLMRSEVLFLSKPTL
jgi:hypothetical protein